jgi:hypothetical protein
MIIPTNEKLFKKWAEINGLKANADKADYAARLERNEHGHITNPEYTLQLIRQLQVEIGKLNAAQRNSFKATQQAIAGTLMTRFGLTLEDALIQAVLQVQPESVKPL